jgi:hypothetical protein
MRGYYVVFNVDGSMDFHDLYGNKQARVPEEEVIHGLISCSGYNLYGEIECSYADVLGDNDIQTRVPMKDIFAKAKDVVEGTHLAMAAVNRTYYNDFEGKADAHEEISDYLFGEAGGVY